MFDSNLLFAQHTMAGVRTPIVINNACLSWHRLASNMTYAGARAYVGTLFPVTSSDAAEVITKVLDEHWEKSLPVALWSAQHDVYGSNLRRPYVVAGVFPQRLRVETKDFPARIAEQLAKDLRGYRQMPAKTDKAQTRRIDSIEDTIKYLERELGHFKSMDL